MTHIAAQLAFGESGLPKEDAAAAREARFTDLVRRQTGFVFRVAYAVLRSVEDAEDVVQETFLKLYRLNAWEAIEEERAFLARTAWRVAVGRISRRQSGIHSPEAKTGEMNPEQAAIARNSAEAVHRLIDTLPEELRRALVLSAVRELNSRQIAEILGVSEGTVRTRQMRARNLLKETFAMGEEGMNRDLDKLIDQALTTYSVEDARPGLEGRVLARVLSDGRRQFRFPLWAWAIPALGCVAVVLTNWHAAKPPLIISHAAVPPQITIADPVIPDSTLQRRSTVKAKLARVPQRDTFPAARALTPAELSLLAFANQNPTAAVAFLDREITPLEVDSIEIEPLENQ